MKNIIFVLIFLCVSIGVSSQISINGSQSIEITPDASTGLKKVIVVRNALGATASYTSNSATVSWERFSSLGGGYAEPVSGLQHEGNIYSINLEGNMGYIINDGSNQICFWVCNYADYPYTISDLTVAESDCDRLMLNVVGSAPEIPYYTINGRRMTVDREIKLVYNTLVYNSDSQQYVQQTQEVSHESIGGSVSVLAPLCSTAVTIVPGRFASAWDQGGEVESQWIEPVAVSATVMAEQEERVIDNQQSMGDSGEGLGGSAPAEITFTAVTTDAAIFRRWEFSSTPNFEDVQLTFSDLVVAYVFEEAGTTYVRFVCDNASGSCPFESETFTVTIGDSRLDCPNAFSPGSSEGVNDEWKVSYRSIIEFHCEIFNRWGQKLATLTDPSQGWDGRVGGKPVPSGVYFYVINALGSDGKKYKLSGDINVVSSRRQSSSAASGDYVE